MTNLLNSRKAADSDTLDVPPGQPCSAHGFLETCIAERIPAGDDFCRWPWAGPWPVWLRLQVWSLPRLIQFWAQSKLSPNAALQELMDGNRRFASGRLTAPERDLAILKQNTIEKQEPFAALLSCADSLVPVEMVFDQSIGHIFVARVACNVVTPEIIASLEYGAAVLGTKVILVIGHGNCGAVKATIQAKEVPGQISALYPHIQPAVNQAGPISSPQPSRMPRSRQLFCAMPPL